MTRLALPLLLGGLFLAVPSSRATAQDVELLGARHGTRPPAAYYRELARNPDAFRFTRGRAGRIRPAGSGGPASTGGSGGGAATGPAATLGPRDGPVEGDFAVPVVLGLFEDTPGGGPHSVATIQDDYFGDGPRTIRAYYDEVSGGRLRLAGVVRPWERVDLTRSQVTQGNGALSRETLGNGRGIGNFVYQIVKALIIADPAFDWGQFDNDGPDGIPNSGDDDGFVDALAVIHPTSGAECDGDYGKIWSHKWSLYEALRDANGQGVTIETPSARHGGGLIRIDDYSVQPVLSCDGPELNEIGVFTHEIGHMFGLPDLYDVFGKHAGVGSWDLMATGAWGCDDASPASPCHMGAWSKAMLGWVDVVPLDPGVDHGTVVVSPVHEGRVAYRVDAQDGSGEYVLLENRQAVGFDAELHDQGGLLVWQVDPVRVSTRWGANQVNGGDYPGVRIREADGRGDLLRSGGGRGDAGDPFPGSTGNTVFHAGSTPAADSYLGAPTGLTVQGIRHAGTSIEMDVLTRFSRVTLVADGSAGTEGLFSVDGASPQPSGGTFEAAPFSEALLEAAAGEVLEPGVRRPFDRWADGLTTRARTLVVPPADSTLTAFYEGREVQLDVTLESDAGSIPPARVVSAPRSDDLWFLEGTDVEVGVEPRTGFRFLQWTGPLEGESNPTFVTMTEPVFAGATLEAVYAVPDATLTTPAAADRRLELSALHANEPVAWSVVGGMLPEGMRLRSSGSIEGAPLQTGRFTVTVRARDAIGLTAEGQIVLDVEDAEITPERAAQPFLLGPRLTDPESDYLDRQGNADGRYDLGDFRAWVTRGNGGER
jgi:M6 family metalloprotease-like protein